MISGVLNDTLKRTEPIKKAPFR